MTGAELVEVIRAFETDPRLVGATWDRMADHFPYPDVFTLIVAMPDGNEHPFATIADFRRWLEGLP